MENVRANYSYLDTIYLTIIGDVISEVSGTIIDQTIQKSREIERKIELSKRADKQYNKDTSINENHKDNLFDHEREIFILSLLERIED